MVNFQKVAGLHNAGGMMTGQIGKRNRGRVILAIVCVLMTVTTAGCGKTEEPIPVELVSGDMEELQSDTAGGGAQGDDRDNAADGADDTVDEETQNDAGQDADGEGGGSASQDGAQGAESDLDAQARSVVRNWMEMSLT